MNTEKKLFKKYYNTFKIQFHKKYTFFKRKQLTAKKEKKEKRKPNPKEKHPVINFHE